MSAVAVHVVLSALPGALLAALLIAPELARVVIAGVFGFAPAFVLGLLPGSNSGLLAGAIEWFSGVGQGVQAVGLAQLQVGGGGMLLVGGGLVAFLLYRNAVHRFEGYSPL
ncbi:hypothetical protein LPA44_13895 [Halobacterium sp. KA-4]|nr:hypothetical protein [Halobacterium sp. KA-4]